MATHEKGDAEKRSALAWRFEKLSDRLDAIEEKIDEQHDEVKELLEEILEHASEKQPPKWLLEHPITRRFGDVVGRPGKLEELFDAAVDRAKKKFLGGKEE